MVIHLRLPVLLLSSFLVLSVSTEDVHDLVASESVAKDYKVQSVEAGSNSKYGYPYRVAPTLSPNIQARSDDEGENEAARIIVPVQAKPYGSRIAVAKNDDLPLKKGNQKKSKTTYTYGSTRRRDDDDTNEKHYTSYKEPKYRNFDELEVDFRPRRMDINIPYHEYRRPRPNVSPIDPYLSPAAAPGDTFYPVPKIKTYPPSSYGHDVPVYGAGRYEEDPVHYHGSYGGYSTNGGPSPSYSNNGQYEYHDTYSIKSNEPIIGSIRKRLLDYAGASDLYEAEPDYLKQVSRDKYKYANLGNDYYSYGGPAYRDSYRDFPYVESKITLIRKSRGLQL